MRPAGRPVEEPADQLGSVVEVEAGGAMPGGVVFAAGGADVEHALERDSG